MASIATQGVNAATGIWEKAETYVSGARSMEDACYFFLDAVYAEFEQAMVLARAFLTIPYDELPNRQREWVGSLAGDKGVAGQLSDSTPVLSLVGTRGSEPGWNDIRQSQGHVGIPLVSAAFVEAIPMVSRLMADLGVGVELGGLRGATETQSGGSFIRTFYVADAGNTRDAQGRKIIPAQDFVREHGVKTVFGGGGPYGAGSPHVLACIFFTCEQISHETARAFEPVFAQFRDATRGFVESKDFFG